MSGSLLGAYIFGSVARYEHDARSDLDILAIVTDGEGKVPEADVLSYVPAHLSQLEPSISWYGRNRVAEMFANGELFAWHLYQEAIPIFESEPVLSRIGIPSIYRGALQDIISFERILKEIPNQLVQSPANSAYEFGLIYVCVRNICMSASSVLCDRPDFSRYSPFRLEGVSQMPMTVEEYDIAMGCRMSGQRGMAPPDNLDELNVSEIYSRVSPWIAEVRQCLEVANGRR